MDIPIDAEVECTDGPGGRSTCVILNPFSHRVTHIVVKEKWFPHARRLVPVERVIESTPEQIRVDCTQDQLQKMESFTETRFIQSDIPDDIYGVEDYRVWPYVLPEADLMVPLEHERVPPGELAVHRGSQVRATDGDVGRVDEFLIDPEGEHITHLVLREGHLWGQKDVVIPVSKIGRIEQDRVHLTLSKEEVANLPTIPLRRRQEDLREK